MPLWRKRWNVPWRLSCNSSIVVEEVKFSDFTQAVARFALHENPPDERSDGLDGIRPGEESHRRHPDILKEPKNALANGPDLGFALKWGGKTIKGRFTLHGVEIV